MSNCPARAGFTSDDGPDGCRRWDHPRSRGVYASFGASHAEDGGSSPLARGLLFSDPGLGQAVRIIPARAGFTSRSLAAPQRAADHPRSRGVYAAADPGADLAVGIIPARAGFTGTAAGAGGVPRDHPRSRGVYLRGILMRIFVVGSSPLARGLRHTLNSQVLCWRIIPARAGFTGSSWGNCRMRPDHPRSRGVYVAVGRGMYSWAGSSPLARGLPRRVRPPPSGRADHPRSRGVYRAARAPQRRAVGSSPLARGLPVDAQVAGDLCRIIPARAGFTGVAGCLLGVDADHPRSRGVYPEGGGRTRRAQGSSPLARGLPGLRWIRAGG